MWVCAVDEKDPHLISGSRLVVVSAHVIPTHGALPYGRRRRRGRGRRLRPCVGGAFLGLGLWWRLGLRRRCQSLFPRFGVCPLLHGLPLSRRLVSRGLVSRRSAARRRGRLIPAAARLWLGLRGRRRGLLRLLFVSFPFWLVSWRWRLVLGLVFRRPPTALALGLISWKLGPVDAYLLKLYSIITTWRRFVLGLFQRLFLHRLFLLRIVCSLLPLPFFHCSGFGCSLIGGRGRSLIA